MKRLALAVLAASLIAASAVSAAFADDWVVVPSSAPVLPSASPNGPGLLVPPDLSTPPASPEVLTPQQLMPIWQAAGQAYGIPWQVLAAIDKVESNFGQNMGPSSAGAVGWMQFMPGTWLEYGTDANGDGVADPWNAQDAIYSAARYLAASGGQTDVQAAVFAYNHADWYVQEVLQLAASYGTGDTTFADFGSSPVPTPAQPVSTDAEEQAVSDAEAALADGVARVHKLEAAARSLELDASDGQLLNDRLDAAQAAGQNAADLASARADVTQLRAGVDAANAALASARQAALGSTDGHALAAPIASGGWVFPVGGGPSIAAVAPPQGSTTEIMAPAGTPAYALSDGQVTEASSDPSGDCGIGFTLQGADGQSWSYCHLAYLDPAVAQGASLQAGAQVGLIGRTGAALEPGLTVQSQGSDALQGQSWFSSLADTAYRWQGVGAGSPTFSVVTS
jgi:murein DD-endopeptidase MepM/ murein hydrolase activator NlpD